MEIDTVRTPFTKEEIAFLLSKDVGEISRLQESGQIERSVQYSTGLGGCYCASNIMDLFLYICCNTKELVGTPLESRKEIAECIVEAYFFFAIEDQDQPDLYNPILCDRLKQFLKSGCFISDAAFSHCSAEDASLILCEKLLDFACKIKSCLCHCDQNVTICA